MRGGYSSLQVERDSSGDSQVNWLVITEDNNLFDTIFVQLVTINMFESVLLLFDIAGVAHGSDINDSNLGARIFIS